MSKKVEKWMKLNWLNDCARCYFSDPFSQKKNATNQWSFLLFKVKCWLLWIKNVQITTKNLKTFWLNWKQFKFNFNQIGDNINKINQVGRQQILGFVLSLDLIIGDSIIGFIGQHISINKIKSESNWF